MSKRIISFFLALTMVMGLFGASLSVSATNVAAYDPATGGITFSVSGLNTSFNIASVQVRLGDVHIVQHDFPASAGSTTGTIYAGTLNTASNYVIQVWPSAGTDIIVPVTMPVSGPTVTFTAGANGTIAATVGGAAITSGDNQPVGTNVVFTATPNAGYVVASWTVNGATVTGAEATEASITRTVGDAGLTVAVAFEEAPVPTITGVTVFRPSASANATIGATTQPFTATVAGTGFVGPVPQGVTWSANNGGVMNEQGRLTVPLTVNAGTVITVTATSTANPARFGTISVTARDASFVDGGGGGADPRGGIFERGHEPIVPRFPDDRGPDDVVSRNRVNPEFPVEAIPASVLFNDVPANAWYHDFVTLVVHHGLFHGVGHRTFAPNAPMTRAMFIQVLANLEGVNAANYSAGTAAFNDVAQGAWYYPAVQWASSVGVTTGVGEGNFAPNANVTREQMARLLNQYANHRSVNLPRGAATPFTDAGSVSSWATDDVAAIQAAGIIGGYPDGSFGPQRTATRAEVATIFAMYLQVTGRA